MTRLEEISNDVQYMRFLERERHGIGLHALMGQTCNGARRKEKVNHHTREHMVFHNTLNPLTIEYYNKQHDTILKSYHVVSHPFPKEVENGVLHLTPFTQYRGHRLVNGNYRLYAQNLSPMYTDSKRYQCDIRKHNGGSEREVCVERKESLLIFLCSSCLLYCASFVVLSLFCSAVYPSRWRWKCLLLYTPSTMTLPCHVYRMRK
jgi:hypothetical protein